MPDDAARPAAKATKSIIIPPQRKSRRIGLVHGIRPNAQHRHSHHQGHHQNHGIAPTAPTRKHQHADGNQHYQEQLTQTRRQKHQHPAQSQAKACQSRVVIGACHRIQTHGKTRKGNRPCVHAVSRQHQAHTAYQYQHHTAPMPPAQQMPTSPARTSQAYAHENHRGQTYGSEFTHQPRRESGL